MSNIPCIYCNHKDDTEENGCDIYYHKFKCEKYSAYLDGREDAIDEFVETVKIYYGTNIMKDIDKLAKQLKE